MKLMQFCEEKCCVVVYYLEFCIGRNVALPRGQYLAGLRGYVNLCWFILLSGTDCLQGPLQHSEFTK